MSDFTYIMPFSNERLLDGIIFELKRDNKYDVANLLKGSHLEIEESGYSYYDGGGRWDARAVYIIFYVNPANADFLNVQSIKDMIVAICSDLIPVNVGFDVKDVSFMLDLTKDFAAEDNLILELERTTNTISSQIIKDILPVLYCDSQANI